MESKKCLECGKKYSGKGQKYCTIQCVGKSNIKQPETKKCLACGKEFKKFKNITRRAWEKQDTCSKKCRNNKRYGTRYSLLDHVKFFRAVGITSSDLKSLRGKSDWYPKGIRVNPQYVKWTQQEIKEFREWNQKNV